MKNVLKKYSHAWVFTYCFIYMVWFAWLEKHVTKHYYVIESVVDDYIPFIEIFIIPYLLWFMFIAVTGLYLFFTSKEDFYKIAKMLIIGMTAFLVICTIFPNGQNLRPTIFTRDNIFIDMVRNLYRIDTPTNVLPSIHVYNSLACYIAISHNKKLQHNLPIQRSSLILTILIVLSTVFLKQHSIIDVIAAFFMATVVYQFVYQPAKVKRTALAHHTV